MSSGVIVGIIIALGLLAAVLWKLGVFPFRRGPKQYSTEQLPVAWPERFAEYHHTTNGASCNFEDPLKPGDWEKIEPIIEMGLRNLIRGIRGLPTPWTKKLNISDYIIGFIKPTATNQDGSPALIINGIQSAGTILGYNSAFSPVVIVLPQQANWDHLSYLMYSVWHEGEHDAELANDVGLFWSLIGAGDVHPHRPIENPELPPAPVGLVARQQAKLVCGVKA